MGIVSSGGYSPTLRTVMIFIDGGYLRDYLKKNFSTEKINFDFFTNRIMDMSIGGPVRGELIRVYYYDAIVDHDDDTKKYDEQKEYFDFIKNRFQGYTVKLGRLIKTKKGDYRQKGVDVKLAIDMITMAYLGHYDIALLVAGDDDYLDVVKAIKGAGKRVYGAYFSNNTSKRLIEEFDNRIIIKEECFKEKN